MIAVLDHQNSTGGISRNNSGNGNLAYFDVVATPLQAGDVVIYAFSSVPRGAGSNFFCKFGAGNVNLTTSPFTIDGGSTSVAGIPVGADGVEVDMAVHTITASNLDSVGDGSGTALERFGWAQNSANGRFYGGGFGAVVVRGQTYDSVAGSWTAANASSTTSPQTYAPGTLGTVGANQVLFAMSGQGDGGDVTNAITSTDNKSFPEIVKAATWTPPFGDVAFSNFSTYGVSADNFNGWTVSHAAALGAYGSVIVGAAGGAVVGLINFQAASATASDAWAWQT